MLYPQQILGAIVRIFASKLLQREWVFLHSRVDALISFHRTHPELVPPLVAQRLLVSAEDHRHRCHPGFDIYAICRAIFRHFTSGRREGGSTIEQQIVRVVTNRFEPTLRRKLREIMLASLVAAHFPKSVSPSVYLTIGYYGWQMNNYVQACRRLRLHPSYLSLDEAAAIVARLKYPEPRISPPQRLMQIEQRMKYLKRLYWIHIADGTYDHLGVTKHGSAIRRSSKLTKAVSPISLP
jgi:membrane carboxypeptidase/penicillin-binding protein PbpC